MGIYNVKVTEYAHSTKITRYNKPIIFDYKMPAMDEGELDAEEQQPDADAAKEEKKIMKRTPEEREHCIRSSLNRTKNAIYDLAKSNDWEWFVTLTFDPKIVDSTNYEIVVKELKRFIDNMRKNYAPDLVYLIVPELHADGQKFHFHGLLSNVGNMVFRNSGLKSDGEIIYNLFNWENGFSTATEIKDTIRASAYITKYITKECVQVTKNKRRYYASKNINRPIVQKLNIDLTVPELLETYSPDYLKSIDVPAAGQRVTHMEIDDKLPELKQAESWIDFKSENGKYNFPEYTSDKELYECKVFYEKTGNIEIEDYFWSNLPLAGWTSVEKFINTDKGFGEIIAYRKKK